MSALLKIAWRNLYRQGRRTVITATAMSVGAGLCIAATALTDGMYVDMFDSMVTQNTGHVQIHAPEYPAQKSIYETLDEAKTLATLDGLPEESHLQAAAPRTYGFALLSSKEKASGGQIRGVLPAREKQVTDLQSDLKSGVYLEDEANGGILLGDGLADTLKVKVGDEVVAVTQAADGSLGNALYTVVGTFHSGNTMLDRGGALLHIRDLQELLALPGQIHEVAARADHRKHIPALLRIRKTRTSSSSAKRESRRARPA